MYIHYAFVQQAYNDSSLKEWRRSVWLSEATTNTLLSSHQHYMNCWTGDEMLEEFHQVQAIKASYIHV